MKNLDYYKKELVKRLKKEAKEQKKGFLNMLLGTLGGSLLGYILTGKGVARAGERIIGAGYGPIGTSF